MRILFCSGEVYPFSKSGGLADVAAALPKALTKLNHEIKVITPMYGTLRTEGYVLKKIGEQTIEMGQHQETAQFFETKAHGVTYIFVQHDMFFNRERYYGYEDDPMRFTFFNFAIFEYMRLSDFYPEVLHANDWQTALTTFFLDVKYKPLDERFKQIKTLLSIHNLEKQGSYPLETEKLFGHKNFTYLHMERVNFLKCGIMRASAINTVSENYRNEILTRFYGFTLDGPLKARHHDLYGILNGLDQELYNPSTNPYLFKNYNEKTFVTGKKHNKKMLVKALKLDHHENLPMVAFINRFARQKGIDIIMPILEDYIKDQKITLVAMGYGDALYEQFFSELSRKYPEQVYYEQSFNSELSHQVYAASDIFLLPSLFEPCGLNHMVAMRYGSLPLVRETGGLKDTVTPYNKFTGIGVGFAFKNYDADELKSTLDHALNVFHTEPEAFQNLIYQAMHVNHSLDKMAKQYENLYLDILKQN